jgi:hypothetical protein
MEEEKLFETAQYLMSIYNVLDADGIFTEKERIGFIREKCVEALENIKSVDSVKEYLKVIKG